VGSSVSSKELLYEVGSLFLKLFMKILIWIQTVDG